METSVKKLMEKFLQFGGTRTTEQFKAIRDTVLIEMYLNKGKDEEAYLKLEYIFDKLDYGYKKSIFHGEIEVIIDCTEQDLEDYYEKHRKHHGPIKRTPKKPKDRLGKIKLPNKTENLGKLVDEGEIPYTGSRADQYWNSKKIKLVFDAHNKQIRSGAEIPRSYDYKDIDYVQEFYGLRGIEFGNWLSQQDRSNYLAGLGLSLFDLYHILNFSPKQISLRNKITIAFGARGRGTASAHFEQSTFAINLTRYKRPKKGSTSKRGFDRSDLLTASGGVGSLAHEYGHALDYYGGMFIEKANSGALTGARSARIKPDKKLLKANSLQGLMERLLYKIIWKNDTTHTPFYQRLLKVKGKYGVTDYFFRRNEIFARAFEVYVHFKMQKKKYKNIFLAETKYDLDLYLSLSEMKKLEADFDALINGIKKRI